MRTSDVWARGRSNQNVMVRPSSIQVMSSFGSSAPPVGKPRKKPKEETKFVVGESKLGGEETI